MPGRRLETRDNLRDERILRDNERNYSATALPSFRHVSSRNRGPNVSPSVKSNEKAQSNKHGPGLRHAGTTARNEGQYERRENLEGRRTKLFSHGLAVIPACLKPESRT